MQKRLCCECMAYHRGRCELSGCFLPPEAEHTYDRSVSAFIRARQRAARIPRSLPSPQLATYWFFSRALLLLLLVAAFFLAAVVVFLTGFLQPDILSKGKNTCKRLQIPFHGKSR